MQREFLARRTSRRRVIVGLVIGGTSIAITACSSSGPPPTSSVASPPPPTTAAKDAAPTARPAAPAATVAPTARPVVKVKIGIPPPRSVNQAMPYIGVDKGLYRAHAIDPEFVEIQASPQTIKSLISGELDLADTSTAGLTSSIASGAPLKHLGSISKGLPYAIFAKNEITSLRDLYGRNVAITGVGTLPHLVAMALLRQENLDPDKINFLATGDQNTFLSMLARKVDANVSSIDDLPEAQKDPGIHMLIVAGEKLPNFVRTTVAARDETIREKEDVLVRFLAGYTLSHRYALDHKDEIVELSTRLNQREPSTNAMMFDVYKNYRLLEPNLRLTESELDYMQEINILTKQQNEKLAGSKLLNTEIQKKVLGIIGEYKGT